MAVTAKATIVSAAHAAAIWMPTDASAQANLRERVGAAVEAVEGACAADIAKFCGNVTRGEGRVLQCMQAFDDQLSRRCQFSLYRASRNLDHALDRVERIVKVTGFVASAPGFVEQPRVMDAASELLVQVFGDAGRHARSAVGSA